MRLNNKDINAIRDVASAIFGETATIRLFGSRTDDNKKGGDIDLLIQYNQQISRMERYRLKIKFLVQLKKIIGDQKIDVIIDNGQQHNSIIHQVYNEGILLWQPTRKLITNVCQHRFWNAGYTFKGFIMR